MSDQDERARALLQIIRTEHWNDECLEAILLKALRDERRRVWDEAVRTCEKWLKGCNTKGAWSQKVRELVFLKEYCRQQAEEEEGHG